MSNGNNSFVRMVHPGHQTRIASRIIRCLLLVLLTTLSFSTALPVHAHAQTSTSSAAPSATNATSNPTVSPQEVGVYPLPDLSLSKTVVSSVDNLIGTGGAIQYSPQNITLYNSNLVLRLLGGLVPHDQLLGPDHNVLSQWIFWGVQANVSGSWMPLPPTSNNFTIIGTNRTGTVVIRTMQVGSGDLRGTLKVVYDATSTGPLKWDLTFTPGSSGSYRLVYTWSNMTSHYRASDTSRLFQVSYGVSNYTLSWNDVEGSLATASTIMPGRFQLSIGLGSVPAGTSVFVDPSLVSTVQTAQATANTFQRKVFYEPKGGYYFVFYYDGYYQRYRYSHDGLNWSPVQNPPWEAATSSSVTVFSQGQTVVVPLTYTSCSISTCTSGVSYVVGNITGPNIAWDNGHTAMVLTSNCSQSYPCDSVSGLSVTVSSTGWPVISFDYQNVTNPGNCISSLYAFYGGPSARNIAVDSTIGCVSGLPDTIRSVVVPSDSQGTVRVFYQKSVQNGSSWTKTLRSIWLSNVTNNTLETLDNDIADSPDFSAVSTSNYHVQVVWKTLPGDTISSASRGPSDTSWTFYHDILSGTASYPSLTVDFSTNNVYVVAVNSQSNALLMKEKAAVGNWSDTSISSVVNNQLGPVNLDSNFASASAENSSTINLIWTTGPSTNGLYNVTFASVPIQTVWSPYSDPADPWNGDGIAPYAQYFTNLGESVSPGSGMLTVSQKGLQLPGRGLDLSFTLVYTEPSSFLNGRAYNYENYPWAPMGNGWQLNFPWMENVSAPRFIHLWNGESYRIPSSFWTNNTSTFENHQGEDFTLAHFWGSNGVLGTSLTTKSGVTYFFDLGKRLVDYYDGTPNHNQVTFYYLQNRIYEVYDTVGRVFILGYNGAGFLVSLGERNPYGVQLSNGISLQYSGQSLASVTDWLGRATSYTYQAVTDPVAGPWLISQITYPTGWLTNYTYARFSLGTEAYTFRVSRQWVEPSVGSATPVREFVYSFTPGAGDQLLGSVVSTYNGTRLVGYTRYSFSFGAIEWNVTNSAGGLVKGFLQRFGINGEVVKETTIITDQAGGSGSPGSYTSFYSYDSWGNLIYSRQTVNPSTGTYHETFHAFYNDGLPPAFNAFQETFSQDQGTAPDNLWNVRAGSWMAQNGQYSAAPLRGEMADMISSADIGVSDIYVSASIYIGSQFNTTTGANPRVGLFAHYNQTSVKNYKWAVVLVNSTTGSSLSVLDEWGHGVGIPTSCKISHGWWTFTLTSMGTYLGGTATPAGGLACNVGALMPTSSPAINATGFGLYAGGYSTIFGNVTVTTASANLSNGFFNSFYSSGAPYSIVHDALAGAAEHQNGKSSPVEMYYSYTPWGSVAQSKQRYDTGTWPATSGSYDSYGNLVQRVDARGNYTLYSYSSKYSSAYMTNRTQTLSPGNTQITSLFTYNYTTGMVLSSLDPNGHNVTYHYDVLSRPTRISYPTGDYVAYSYNDTANYVDVTIENGWHTRKIYDGLGRLQVTEQFLNGKPYSNETSTYNWQNKLSSTTDALADTTYYQYDPLGRSNSTVKPDNTSVRELYNDTGSWILSIDEYNNYACKIYDRLGRVVTLIEYSDQHCHPPALVGYSYVTNYYYDEVGNLVKVISSSSQSTIYKYDNLDRIVLTTYPDNTSETYGYDNNGNLIAKTDRKGVGVSYSYDSLNRVTYVTYKTNPSTREYYSYDNNGNLLMLQSTNATMRYTYDARDRIMSETYIVNGNFALSVSPNSVYFFCSRTQCSPTTSNANLTVTSINGYSGTIALSYVPPGSGAGGTLLSGSSSVFLPSGGKAQTTVTAFLGTLSGTFQWAILGQNGNFTALTGYTIQEYICTSPLCPMSPSGGTSSSSPSIPSAPPGASYTVSYAYSGQFLSNITYPDGTLIHYGYDGLGRPVSISSISSPVVTTYVNLAYNKNSQITNLNYNSGLQGNYTYDSVGRTSSINLVNPGKKPVTYLSLNYQYNKTGTVASVTGSVNGLTVNEQYAYDSLDRLINSAVTSNGATSKFSYRYDPVGNTLNLSMNNQTTSYAYNVTNNELKSSTGSTGTTSYSYDADGNLAGKGIGTTTWTYTWDAAGRLLKAANNGVLKASYAYDAQGRRVESAETSTIFYAYQGTETLYEDNATSKTSNDYIYAAGIRLAELSGGTINYYHTDSLGSTRLVTTLNNKGIAVLFSNSYQPFGQDNGTPTGSQSYRFTGKPVSQTTGLYYDYQRWYDPTTGRFISEDRFPGIVSDPQSLNGYTYASDSPTVVTDPTGLSGYVPNVNVSTGSCPSFWNNPWGSFSCQLSRTPTPVADVVASYDLAAWGIEACWEDCGQLLSDAGSLLGGDTTATTGSDVTAISRTGPTTSVTGDVTIGTDTTRVVTSDNPATLTSETSQLTRDSNWAPNPGGRLGGSLHRQVVNDIAEFIKSRGLTPDREYYFQSVHRFADVVALDGPGGSPVEIYQVGRMTSQSLLPVAREIYAAGDILDALGIPVVFVPYNV